MADNEQVLGEEQTEKRTLRESIEIAAEAGADPEQKKAEEVEKAWEQHEREVKPKERPIKQKVEQKAESDAPIAAPEFLSPEDKEEFQKLSPSLKKRFAHWAHSTRADYSRKTMEAAQLRQRYEPLERTVQEVDPELAREGIGLDTLVRRAVGWHRYLREQPVEAVRQLIDEHGIDLQELAEAAPQQKAPTVPQELLSELEESRRFREQVVIAQQAQFVNATNDSLQKWMADKPLFKDPATADYVERLMARDVAALRQANPHAAPEAILEKVYQAVVNTDPELRRLIQDAERAKTLQTQSERTQVARRAQGLRGGPGAGTPRTAGRSIAESLRLAADGRL